MIRKAKLESWKNFCKFQNKDTICSNLYRIVGKSKINKDVKLTTREGLPLNEQQALDMIRKKFFPPDDLTDDNQEHQRIRNEAMGQIEYVEVEPELSYKEVLQAFEGTHL